MTRARLPLTMRMLTHPLLILGAAFCNAITTVTHTYQQLFLRLSIDDIFTDDIAIFLFNGFYKSWHNSR